MAAPRTSRPPQSAAQRFDALAADYRPLAAIPDEFIDPSGKQRSYWVKFLEALTELEPDELDLELVPEPEPEPPVRRVATDPVSVSELANTVEPRDPLAGSVLSPQTWRQAFQAATKAANRTARRAS